MKEMTDTLNSNNKINSNYNLPPEEIYKLLIADFEDSWNCLANQDEFKHKGNFNFALLDMILLEFVSRYCEKDKSNKLLKYFSNALYNIDKNYFIKLELSKKIKLDFCLPYHIPIEKESNSYKNDELLWVLFDLIRNGHAHYYQEIIGEFKDNKKLIIAITGPTEELTIKKITSRNGHLSVGQLNNERRDIILFFRPEIMFLDIKKSVENSKIFESELKSKLDFEYFNKKFDISGQEFFNKLRGII
ncbi:MAG: hypothetical protein ACP5JU_02945 [Minisyncoccia bacterium]